MVDRETVIKGLENCITGFDCPPECPYLDDCNDLTKPMFVELAKDALALLKEQEAVEPITMQRINDNFSFFVSYFRCSNCKYELVGKDVMFCSHCGRAVKWE